MPTEKALESSLLHIAIRLVFAEGEIGGTLCMRSHILVRGVTTKFCDNPFIFKNEIEKEGLPRDSTPALGAGGPEFKSRRPDQNISRIFFRLCKTLFTPNFRVEFCQTGGLNSHKSFNSQDFAARCAMQKHGLAGVLFRNC